MGHRKKEIGVFAHLRLNIGTQDFDSHWLTIWQTGFMDLGNGCGSNGRLIKAFK